MSSGDAIFSGLRRGAFAGAGVGCCAIVYPGGGIACISGRCVHSHPSMLGLGSILTPLLALAIALGPVLCRCGVASAPATRPHAGFSISTFLVSASHTCCDGGEPPVRYSSDVVHTSASSGHPPGPPAETRTGLDLHGHPRNDAQNDASARSAADRSGGKPACPHERGCHCKVSTVTPEKQVTADNPAVWRVAVLAIWPTHLHETMPSALSGRTRHGLINSTPHATAGSLLRRHCALNR